MPSPSSLLELPVWDAFATLHADHEVKSARHFENKFPCKLLKELTSDAEILSFEG